MTPPEGDLFGGVPRPEVEPIRDGVVLLPGFARDPAILAVVRDVQDAAPPRRMTTPGGLTMSVAMTSCGGAGWIADRNGYRYSRVDPASGRPWPDMPPVLRDLAVAAAARSGKAGTDAALGACRVNLTFRRAL